jgi:hypothetical protein
MDPIPPECKMTDEQVERVLSNFRWHSETDRPRGKELAREVKEVLFTYWQDVGKAKGGGQGHVLLNAILSCVDRLRSSESQKLLGNKGLLQLEAVMRLLDRRDLYATEDEYMTVKSCFSPYPSFAECIHWARHQHPAPKPRDALLCTVLLIGYESMHYLPESLSEAVAGRKKRHATFIKANHHMVGTDVKHLCHTYRLYGEYIEQYRLKKLTAEKKSGGGTKRKMDRSPPMVEASSRAKAEESENLQPAVGCMPADQLENPVQEMRKVSAKMLAYLDGIDDGRSGTDKLREDVSRLQDFIEDFYDLDSEERMRDAYKTLRSTSQNQGRLRPLPSGPVEAVGIAAEEITKVLQRLNAYTSDYERFMTESVVPILAKFKVLKTSKTATRQQVLNALTSKACVRDVLISKWAMGSYADIVRGDSEGGATGSAGHAPRSERMSFWFEMARQLRALSAGNDTAVAEAPECSGDDEYSYSYSGSGESSSEEDEGERRGEGKARKM